VGGRASARLLEKRPGGSEAVSSRAAVIGGSGYVGSRLALSLASSGVETVVLDVAPAPEDIVGPCEVVECDIITGHGLEALSGCDTVFLMAAALAKLGDANPQWAWDLGIRGVVNVLGAAIRLVPVPRVVFPSTVAVYAPQAETVPVPEAALCGPVGLYATSKLAGETIIASACSCSSLQAFILRLFTIYGPGPSSGRRGHFVASWLERAASGQPLTIFGDGSRTLDLTHISDVLQACRLCIEAPPSPGRCSTYNIGSGRATPLATIARWIQEVNPSVTAIFKDDVKPSLIRPIGDISHARQELGYQPTIFPEEGVKATASQYFLQARAQSSGRH